jgi:hypothetical protein
MTKYSAPIAQRDPAVRLALIAVGGVALYLLVDIVLAILRPDVNVLHDAESDYGVGRFLWLMDLNFLLRCALSLAAAGAILRVDSGSGRLRLGAGFLVAWGLGSGLLAFFPDNPPGAPVTTSGLVHLNLALLAFGCVFIGTVLLSVKFRLRPQMRQIATWLLSISVVAVVPLLLLGHNGFGPQTMSGLYERLFLGLELLWILLVGARILSWSWPSPPAATKRP